MNVLQCGSTTLTSAQCGYSIVELELLSVVGSLEKSSFFLKGAHNVQVFSDHAPLCGLERKDLSSIGNQRIVRMLERSRRYCFSLHYIKGIKNALADALSCQPMQDVWQAEEFARFGESCMARKVFCVVGTVVPEHREDVQVMAEKGKDCPEYTNLVRFLRSGQEVKDTPPDLPARAHASVVTEMGV